MSLQLFSVIFSSIRSAYHFMSLEELYLEAQHLENENTCCITRCKYYKDVGFLSLWLAYYSVCLAEPLKWKNLCPNANLRKKLEIRLFNRSRQSSAEN